MLLLLGPCVGCCRCRTGGHGQLTGQRPFDPEEFLRYFSAGKAALGSPRRGLPVMNRHFQHLVSLSLSLSLRQSPVFICAGSLALAGQASVCGTPCHPPPAWVGRAPPATSCGLDIQQGRGHACAPHGCGPASLLHTAWGWQPLGQAGWGWSRQDAGVGYFMVGIAEGVPAGRPYRHPTRWPSPLPPSSI